MERLNKRIKKKQTKKKKERKEIKKRKKKGEGPNREGEKTGRRWKSFFVGVQ